VSEKVISFEGSKGAHIEAKKREKFAAMKKAFQAAREQGKPKAATGSKNTKCRKPKKKR